MTTTLSKGRLAQNDLLRRIEAAGGWEQIIDLLADGKNFRFIADIYGTDRVQLRRLVREHVDQAQLNLAVQDGAEGMVEDARENLEGATPESVYLRQAQFNSLLKLAGYLNKEKFGEAKQQLSVNLSISDLHLQAVKTVGREQRAPIEGTFTSIPPQGEPDGQHLLR